MKRYIAEGLEGFLSNNNYPWHMPGHKRKNSIINENSIASGLVIDRALDYASLIDVTEVPGTDDLYNPEEMILASMKELTRVYNTYASYYLVNGSTGGILAAISACFCGEEVKKENSDFDIIIAGNCHKSVHNAVEILGLKACYVEPKWRVDNELQIQGSILPEDVERICKDNTSAKAMVITSPTYEGVVSDVKAISEITHKYGIALIVDEAHGAHLPFAVKWDRHNDTELNNKGIFPASAVKLGADIVVQSIHKTLTGLTQTAIMHINNEALDSAVRKYLSVYMTSSPSYVMLCSIERAISDATKADYRGFAARLEDFRNKAGSFKNLMVLEKNAILELGGFGYDNSRIVIMSKTVTGIYLQQALKRLGNIVVEMSGINYVVLISTYVDEKAAFMHLYNTLALLDKELDKEGINLGENEKVIDGTDKRYAADYKDWYNLIGTPAKDNIYAYPPGSYIIRNKEIITKEAVDKLVELNKSGIHLRGNLI